MSCQSIRAQMRREMRVTAQIIYRMRVETDDEIAGSQLLSLQFKVVWDSCTPKNCYSHWTHGVRDINMKVSHAFHDPYAPWDSVSLSKCIWALSLFPNSHVHFRIHLTLDLFQSLITYSLLAQVYRSYLWQAPHRTRNWLLYRTVATAPWHTHPSEICKF